MSKEEHRQNVVFRNLANIVSILGVVPICILFGEHGYQFLFPLIIYNNVMDDLDGVLAAKLNIRSDFGALLDNVCDAIAHPVFVMVVAMHFAQDIAHPYLGAVCLTSGLVATAAMIVRVVTRISPTTVTGTGSPTNELIRHVLLVLIVAEIFNFNPSPYLAAIFAFHAVSMIVPFKMRFLIRGMTKSALAIGMVNIALLVAWLSPYAAPIVAASFFVTYLASFVVGGIRWKNQERQTGLVEGRMTDDH
ncbi:MAG: CDP-alcohol phosphatidyltransferase family protein [Pirellulaceae bacterium]|jgi:phosphatidylserine synthase